MMYFWHEIGYVTTDDWEDLDTDKLFQYIKSSTEKANEAREEGYADVKIEGWAQTPFIDYQESIIYWAIKGHEVGGSNFINAQAVKLGRKGFSVLIWTGEPGKFTSAQDVLAPELANYEYAQGLAYQDFVEGQDAVAALGAGGLVYKLATGKTAAKAGFWALVAVLTKKFWYLLLFPLVWLRRRYFKK
jgi:uncharacterized membrane-anchored protein